MSALTKKEWMEYLEKTWDAAQKEAWSEPQFECPRCGHCCQIQQAAQQALEADGGNCYGDGTVYRGQRSKDSSVTTYTAKLKEKNHG